MVSKVSISRAISDTYFIVREVHATIYRSQIPKILAKITVVMYPYALTIALSTDMGLSHCRTFCFTTFNFVILEIFFDP